ncbi:hypothetical protein [Anatilimnocola floriformis]|uniref:hypothetical protein n=1 Tax=Anatilimnocola floriformis TaxID=2948575 RepID=UPI0020C5A7BF|nr:hypothetical protein [Anatilimnocola floriformis]
MSLVAIASPSPNEFSGAQLKSLRELVSIKTNSDELSVLVREELDTRLDLLASVDKKFDVVVFQMIQSLERDDKLVRFIEVLSVRKPHLQACLTAILAGDSIQPPAAYDIRRLEDLRKEFENRRENFKHLKAYKKLHDTLHAVSGVMPQVKIEHKSRVTDQMPISDVIVDTLEDWKDDIEKSWSRTEDPDPPPGWVTKFQTAIDQFLGNDPSKHVKALDGIENIPQQQLRSLNEKLVSCATKLEAQKLVGMIDAMPTQSLGLTGEVARFRNPCDRLVALVSDHKLCQRINDELQSAAAAAARLSLYSVEEIDDWPEMQRCLQRWAGQSALKEVVRTQGAADQFKSSPSAATFRSLIEKFSKLFKKTDEKLLSLTEDLFDASHELHASLEKKLKEATR